MKFMNELREAERTGEAPPLWEDKNGVTYKEFVDSRLSDADKANVIFQMFCQVRDENDILKGKINNLRTERDSKVASISAETSYYEDLFEVLHAFAGLDTEQKAWFVKSMKEFTALFH